MTYSATQYLLDDLPRTLFPLGTTKFLIETGADLLYEYLYTKILATPRVHQFPPQTLCHAAKDGFHLRRTLKLDPSAELFIYDIVYRNRGRFRKDHVAHRRSFGYRFEGGKPISPMSSYREFRDAVTEAAAQYAYSLRLDVALYFNSIYHHDLVAYCVEAAWEANDVANLGTFLREINSGRSIDCLPHGLNPCKALGAEFLKFIDHNALLRSPLQLRFLDDIQLFADSRADLTADLVTLQQLLGAKGLSLNSAKTRWGEGPEGTIEQEIDDIKVGLLQIRQKRIEVSGEEVIVSEEVLEPLEPSQTEYLLELLRNPEIDEADAELVLSLLTEQGGQVLEHLGNILPRFPALAKTIYVFLGKTGSREGLADILLDFLRNEDVATEYQLFWLACCAQEYLSDNPGYGEILMALYEHTNATALSQARVLEIPEQRFGMPEIRAQHLRTGESTWRSWAAAVGCHEQAPQTRNHLLSYFGNGSPLNRVIADIVTR